MTLDSIQIEFFTNNDCLKVDIQFQKFLKILKFGIASCGLLPTLKKNFGIFSPHLRYLPKLTFLDRTQLAVFRIEYNAFSKAKFGNFQRLLILNIYLQTIIMSEKNSI